MRVVWVDTSRKDASVEIQNVKILNVKNIREKLEQVMEQNRTMQEKSAGQAVVHHIQRRKVMKMNLKKKKKIKSLKKVGINLIHLKVGMQKNEKRKRNKPRKQSLQTYTHD